MDIFQQNEKKTENWLKFFVSINVNNNVDIYEMLIYIIIC